MQIHGASVRYFVEKFPRFGLDITGTQCEVPPPPVTCQCFSLVLCSIFEIIDVMMFLVLCFRMFRKWGGGGMFVFNVPPQEKNHNLSV